MRTDGRGWLVRVGLRDRRRRRSWRGRVVSVFRSQKGKRDVQKRYPDQILDQCRDQLFVSEPVLQERVSDRARPPEDDGGGEEDLERVHKVSVGGELEAEEDVVDQRDGNGARDAVVGEHVCFLFSFLFDVAR
jgi:hypothetical protein